jgi:peptidylprolyl isomerase
MTQAPTSTSAHPAIARRRRRRAVLSVVAAMAAGLLLASCSSDGDDAETVDEIPESAVDLDAKPDTAAVLPSDRGEPPTELEIRDLVEGEGDEASAGDVVSVHYVGVDWEAGEQFDASWDRGQPFTFELGAGRVIAGWDQGVVGMQVGGRRVLTIPPDLAYGEQGAGDVIGPGATLVFVVDLLEVG